MWRLDDLDYFSADFSCLFSAESPQTRWFNAPSILARKQTAYHIFQSILRQLEKCASNNSQTAQEPTHTLRAQTVQVRGGEEREGEGKRPGAKKGGERGAFPRLTYHSLLLFFQHVFPIYRLARLYMRLRVRRWEKKVRRSHSYSS